MVNLQCSTSHYLGLVTTTEASLSEGTQLALDELFAELRNTVDKHLTVKMVELVLHHASQVSLYPLIVVLKVLIVLLYMDTCRTSNLLVDSRQ